MSSFLVFWFAGPLTTVHVAFFRFLARLPTSGVRCRQSGDCRPRALALDNVMLVVYRKREVDFARAVAMRRTERRACTSIPGR